LDNVSFAGPSWVPETASINKGYYVLDQVSTTSGASSVGADNDGSVELLTAFCNSAITGKKNDTLVKEAYYSSIYALLGLKAMEENSIIRFPEELSVD
jgi:hypothetical protein